MSSQKPAIVLYDIPDNENPAKNLSPNVLKTRYVNSISHFELMLSDCVNNAQSDPIPMLISDLNTVSLI